MAEILSESKLPCDYCGGKKKEKKNFLVKDGEKKNVYCYDCMRLVHKNIKVKR